MSPLFVINVSLMVLYSAHSIFLLFFGEFARAIMLIAIPISLVQILVNVYISQRYMKKQLRKALSENM